MASARRKSAAIALAVVGVAGLSLASAAQLNVNSATLGAGQDVVASCDSDAAGIGVDFQTAYVDGAYETTGVVLSGVDALCADLTVDVTLADGTGASLADATDVVPTGGGTFTITGLDVPAEDVENVAVVIYG